MVPCWKTSTGSPKTVIAEAKEEMMERPIGRKWKRREPIKNSDTPPDGKFVDDVTPPGCGLDDVDEEN